ncbi:hypothetical protein HHI36_017626 [Cryptolaemus montrouzieri]|uniref:Uncharacterized protein n=1 Tax=Cryptolaemus montrouzieri TaxID=559131 RepID=A0ABD2NP26_9CUCU
MEKDYVLQMDLFDERLKNNMKENFEDAIGKANQLKQELVTFQEEKAVLQRELSDLVQIKKSMLISLKVLTEENKAITSQLEQMKELQQLNKETKESESTIPSVSTDNSRIDSLTLDEIEERLYGKIFDRVYEELKENKAIISTSRTRMATKEKTPGGIKAPLKINSGQSVHEALNCRDSYSGALKSSKDALKNESNKNTFGNGNGNEKDESKRSHLQYGSGFVRGVTSKSQTINLPMIMTDFHCRKNLNGEDVGNGWQTVGEEKPV